MKLPRRRFLHLAAGAAAFPAISRIARAQTYPTRPVHLVVGFAAGQGADIIARLMGQWLSERLGQHFIIENRPGAGGIVGTEAVVRAPPDGHTLLLVTPGNAINATLYDKLNHNFLRDISPVASIVRVPQVMEVHPSFPTRTVPEFIAYAKSNPGKLNFASAAGNGSMTHLAGELFKMMTGVGMLHVPYRGSPLAMTDLLGGRVQVMFDAVTSSIEHLRAGKLRALGVATATRLEALADLPTIGESVAGYEASGWNGIAAPTNTPPEIIDKLNKEINAALVDPKIQARLAELGAPVFEGSPADFRKFIAEETEKWGKVIKFVGIKAD
jgi:tripartite-type tricarboxylate transporter receptor subunit TctC